MKGRGGPKRALDVEALPALVHVVGDTFTALNERGAAHLGLRSALTAAAESAKRHRRGVAVRVQGSEEPARLLLATPIGDGAQVLLLDVAWDLDSGRLFELAPALTPREREVVGLLVEGFGPGHVAERLGISWHTARSHIRNAYRALGIKERAEIAQLGRALLTPHVRGWPTVANSP